jgi:hypothetical protein
MMWLLIISAGLLFTAPVSNKDTEPENKGNPTSDQWEVVRNNNGVVTYVRWLDKNDGTRTRERKGDMQVDCPSNSSHCIQRYVGYSTDVSQVYPGSDY